MKRFKIGRYVFAAAACSMALLTVTPNFSLPVSAATLPGAEEISPLADIITWVYERRGNEIWKRLYNATTNVWVGDWIYVGPATNN